MLFVHGVGIREPDYARSAIRALRKEFAKSTNDPAADADLIVESAYWAPAVIEREDRLLRAAFPDRVGGWFSGLNNLTQRISNGSSLSMLPLALSGLVRHVPGIPKIHWPTLRWAVSNFVGDIVAYQVTPNSQGGLRRRARVRRRGAAPARRPRHPTRRWCVVAHSLGSVIASDHFYDLHKGRSTRCHPAGARRDLHLLLHVGQPDRAVDGAVRRLQPAGADPGQVQRRTR